MAQQSFDPNMYLSKVKGRDYLEVKWRIAWMRSEHPDARLETELVSHEGGRAVMRARVELPDGGMATGWGSETATTFENYIEKAETKAIGRALTALGYGTPAGAEDEAELPPVVARVEPAPSTNYSADATPPQRARIKALAGELRMDPVSLNSLLQQHTGAAFEQLNKRQASGVIDLLESRRQAHVQAS